MFVIKRGAIHILFIGLCIQFCRAQVPNSTCGSRRTKATSLTIKCCSLINPQIDPGYKECARGLRVKAGDRDLTPTDRMAINICAEECNYIGHGYIDSNPPFVLELENIKQNIMTYLPAPKKKSINYMLDAYKLCEKFQKNHPNKMGISYPHVDYIKDTCDPFALKITLCIRMHAMQTCPPEFFKKSPECQETRDFFKQCVANIRARV